MRKMRSFNGLWLFIACIMVAMMVMGAIDAKAKSVDGPGFGVCIVESWGCSPDPRVKVRLFEDGSAIIYLDQPDQPVAPQSPNVTNG